MNESAQALNIPGSRLWRCSSKNSELRFRPAICAACAVTCRTQWSLRMRQVAVALEGLAGCLERRNWRGTVVELPVPNQREQDHV